MRRVLFIRVDMFVGNSNGRRGRVHEPVGRCVKGKGRMCSLGIRVVGVTDI